MFCEHANVAFETFEPAAEFEHVSKYAVWESTWTFDDSRAGSCSGFAQVIYNSKDGAKAACSMVI